MSLDVRAIRDSFERVKPIGGQVATRFYAHLMTDHPEAKPLFADLNMDKQKAALIKSLAFIVDNLEQTDQLVPYLKKMGSRHVDYGTQAAHYPWVGAALIATFKDFLGEGWTPYIEAQWISAFGVIAETMLKGAEEDSRTPSEPVAAVKEGPVAVKQQGHASTVLDQTLDSSIEIPRELRALIRTKVRQKVRQLIKAEIDEALVLERRELETQGVETYVLKVG